MNPLIRTSLTIAIFISLVQAIQKCSKDCEKYGEDLICADNGITWFNEQCMRACSTTEKVKIAHKGLCKEYRELYPVVGRKGNNNILCKDCGKYGMDLTCASDGFTWYNEHCLRACLSDKSVTILYKGVCKPNDVKDPFQNIDDKPQCNEKCEKSGQDLTCGNDGLTWFNEYCMRACSLLKKVEVEHKGPCKGTINKEKENKTEEGSDKKKKDEEEKKRPHCSRKCEKFGNHRVCATDGRTWMNKKCMRLCSTVKKVKVLHKGPC